MVSIFQFDSSHLIRFNSISFIIHFMHSYLKDYCHSIYVFFELSAHINTFAGRRVLWNRTVFIWLYWLLHDFKVFLWTVVIYFRFLKSTGMCSLTFKKNVQIIIRIVFGDKISPVIMQHQFEFHGLRHHGYGWETLKNNLKG